LRISYIHYKYPFKVWLTILCIAPYVGIWLNAIRIRQFENLNELIFAPFLIIPAGLIISSPFFAVFTYLYKYLQSKQVSAAISKFIFSILGVVCVYLIFYLIGGKEMLQFGNKDGFLFISSYAFWAILAPLLFAFDKKPITDKDLTF
jgi:hypothetical protein